METDRDEAINDRKREVYLADAANGLAMADVYISRVKELIPDRLERTIKRQTGELTPDESELLKREREITEIVSNINGPQKSEPKIYTDARAIEPRRGRIICTNYAKGWSVQQIGDISYVCHEHGRLDRIPEKGEIVIVRYDEEGKGMVDIFTFVQLMERPDLPQTYHPAETQ